MQGLAQIFQALLAASQQKQSQSGPLSGFHNAPWNPSMGGAPGDTLVPNQPLGNIDPGFSIQGPNIGNIDPGFSIPPNVLANLQRGGLASAGGSALRSTPPKGNSSQPPGGVPVLGTQNQPGMALGAQLGSQGGNSQTTASTQPQRPPTQNAGGPGGGVNPQPDYAQQMQGLLGQFQPAPGLQQPQMQGADKNFLLGQAIAAALFPKTTPFVGQALSYDTDQREKDYERKYQAALDQWKARADASSASNQGLVQKAEILKSAASLPASLAIDRSVAIPKINAKDPPFKQNMMMADYYDRIAAARLSAGATPQQIKEATDLAASYRANASQDRLIDISEGKLPARAGTLLPDGTIVQPGSAPDIAYQKLVADADFAKHRVGFETQKIQQADARIRNQAASIANTAGFHADEIAARYNINQADRQTRMTIAILGLENSNARATQSEVWHNGVVAYQKNMDMTKAAAEAQARGQDLSGFGGSVPAAPTPPATPGPVNVNVEVLNAAQQAKTLTGADPNAIPTIADAKFNAAIHSGRFAALDPNIKMQILGLANAGATFTNTLKSLTNIASGKAKSTHLTAEQALQALAALASGS